MNLNTLAAKEADYKSGSLPVALYPNAMRREQDGKQTFYGLGIGDWAQSPIPNPQSPIPNPQSPFNDLLF